MINEFHRLERAVNANYREGYTAALDDIYEAVLRCDWYEKNFLEFRSIVEKAREEEING